jgi:hypothetical protein
LAPYIVPIPELAEECPLSLDAMLDVDFDANIALQAIAAAITSTPGNRR